MSDEPHHTGLFPVWERSSVELSDPTNLDKVLEEAGLAWEVTLEPLTFHGKTSSNFLALVRSDSHEVLDVCGRGYRLLQNREVFSFFLGFLKEAGLTLHRAGQLGQGSLVWALAKLPGTHKVRQSDPVSSYLLLCHPYHHGWAGSLMVVLLREASQVCFNLADGRTTSKGPRFCHHREWNDLAKMRALTYLDNIQELHQDVFDKAEFLASAPATEHDVIGYLGKLMMHRDPLRVLQLDLTPRARNAVAVFQQGPGSSLLAARDTWWGAFLAFCYYLDHTAGMNSYGSNPDRKLNLAWFGPRAWAKQKAFKLALQEARRVVPGFIKTTEQP